MTNDELLSKLPYGVDKPQAQPLDIAEEIAALVAAITGVVVGARDNPRLAAQLVTDATKEPGTSILVQKTRLALAIDSFVSGEIEAMLKMLYETATRQQR